MLHLPKKLLLPIICKPALPPAIMLLKMMNKFRKIPRACFLASERHLMSVGKSTGKSTKPSG
jgi:hypothetical protein